MNEHTPTLPSMRNDGQTLKPEDLDGQIVTVVNSQSVVRKDGSMGHKWLVRHDDGTLGLYWAPGMAPPQQVAQFFRSHPQHELRLLVKRHDSGDGYAKWSIQQLEAPSQTASLPDGDPAVDQVPF